MYTTIDIETVTSIIKKNLASSCLEIFLFGSYAKNTAQKDSDLDIAIILNKKLPREEKLATLNTLWWETSQKGYSVDFLLKNSSDYEEEKKLPTLSRVIAREGKLLWKKV
jgi:predicted nucleotidyltransferase